MRIEVTRDHDPDPKKALRREVWVFDHNTYGPGLCMRLCAYYVETRKSTRCRVWDVQGVWPKSHVHVGPKTLSQPEAIPLALGRWGYSLADLRVAEWVDGSQVKLVDINGESAL